MRKCDCNRVRPGPFTLDQCKRCWLWHYSPKHKAKWGNKAVHKKPCEFKSDEPIGERRCASCRGEVWQKEYGCSKGHGQEGRIVLLECAGCGDYHAKEERPEILQRADAPGPAKEEVLGPVLGSGDA